MTRSAWAEFICTVVVLAAVPAEGASADCARCHREIYDSYRRTPMAQSSGRPGSGLIQESFARGRFRHQATGIEYRVWKAAADVYRFSFPPSGSELPVRYFVGSGAKARAYLWQTEGFFFQAPVTYYTAGQRWDLAPGYDQYKYPYLTRPVLPGCLQCHATGLNKIAGTMNGYAEPPFSENGIGCERCHGDGEAHVARMGSGRKGEPAIVNPAKLEPGRRNDVCAQCHLAGEARVVRAGRGADGYKPGDRLADHIAVFVKQSSGSRMKVTSHVENLADSVCRRASPAMWCGTCHDPHRVPREPERAAWFRSKCMACHEQRRCSEARERRTRVRDDCTACHMPKNPVADAQHVVYTDHSIPRRPHKNDDRPDAAARLVPFGGGGADERDLGLAYAIVGQRENSPSYLDQGYRLLGGVKERITNDAEALAYLAELYNRRGDPASAIPLYERAIALDPEQLTAPVSLGALRMEQGRDEDAIRLWRDALKKNPGLVLVRTNLALLLLRKGERAEAAQVLKRALEFNPAATGARELLEKMGPAGTDSGRPK